MLLAASQELKNVSEDQLSEALDRITLYGFVLKVLGVPINKRINELTPTQKVMYESSQGFMEKINEFAHLWAKANT